MLDKNHFDISQAFQTYLAFVGDPVRTAVALNLRVEQVKELATAENWDEKVKQWTTLREGSSADVAIAVNRASCFVTAKRLQDLINRAVNHLSTMDPQAMMEYLTTARRKDRDGNETGGVFSAKPLVELAKAAEACGLMAQRALGDTTDERPEGSQGQKGSSIAMMVQAAMAAAESVGVSAVLAVRDQNETAPPVN